MLQSSKNAASANNNNKFQNSDINNNNNNNNNGTKKNKYFNLNLSYIDCATTSLVREFLSRKGFKKTLDLFDTEKNESAAVAAGGERVEGINSRSKLVEFLNIQEIFEDNKNLASPFKTVLEILISHQTADMDSRHTYFKSYSLSSSSSNQKKNNNDLKIEDTNEGELVAGDDDKRMQQLEKRDNIERQKYECGKYRIERDGGGGEQPKPKSTSHQPIKLTVDAEKEEDRENDEFEPKLAERASRRMKQILILDEEEQLPSSLPPKSAALLPTVADVTELFNCRPIDSETAKEIRMLIFGNLTQTLNSEWLGQDLAFCNLSKLKFGLVQKRGGPCGVLASLQAYILLELAFSFGGGESATLSSKDFNLAVFNVRKKERSDALARAIARLLWKCGGGAETAIVANSTPRAHFAPGAKYKSDGITETLNLLKFTSFQSLQSFLLKNIHIFESESNSGCVLLLYSAIFSRKIETIRQDMDDSSNKLMGAHCYCTMEMVNLLIHGRAVSNVFNDSVYLDKLELRGPNKRNDIGLLSLFEHYKSCEVGSYYKTPKFPVWVVCSESHFSVVFALKKEVLNDWKAETRFDLFYYDGLARQDEQIKLTISSKDYDSPTSQSSAPFFLDLIRSSNSSRKVEGAKELIPPLELVLRTKWKGCAVDWNGTDPIL